MLRGRRPPTSIGRAQEEVVRHSLRGDRKVSWSPSHVPWLLSLPARLGEARGRQARSEGESQQSVCCGSVFAIVRLAWHQATAEAHGRALARVEKMQAVPRYDNGMSQTYKNGLSFFFFIQSCAPQNIYVVLNGCGTVVLH